MEKDQDDDHLLSIVKPSAKIGIASSKRRIKIMKEFTAEEARQIANDLKDTREFVQSHVIPHIVQAAKEGHFAVTLMNGIWNNPSNPKWRKTKEVLESLGFTVTMDHGDQRDPYVCTIISWAKK